MLKRNQIFILAGLIIASLILFMGQIWIVPLIAVYILTLYLFKDEFMIVFSIVSFLTLTSTIDPRLRMAVLLLNITSLLYLFLKNQDLRNLKFKSLPNELLYFISGIVFWMIITSLFSSYPKEGFEQVLRTIVFLPVMYLFYVYIKTIGDVRLIVISLISVAVFYSLYLVYELYQNNFILISVEEQLSYVFGMQYLDKNFLGGFISTAILLIISYFFYTSKYKVLLITGLITCTAGVILSNSRAAILSLLISSFVLFWMFNRKIFYRASALFLIVLVIFILSPLSDYFMIYARFESISSGRDYLITAAEKVIENHFFMGAGPSGTRFEMYNHLPFMLGSPEEMFIRKNFYQSELGQAHSFYLFYFTDLGVVGFLISLLFPVLYFRFSFKVMKFNSDNKTEEYFITRALFGIGILMFVRGLLEWGGIFTFGNFNQDLPFWLILSILTFYYSKTKDNLERS